MATYKSSYTGPQIDAAVGHAVNMDVNPTAGHTDRVVSSGGVKSALNTVDESIAIRVSGNKTTYANGAVIGQYVIVNGSTIAGITDGLYKAAKAIPYNTGIDSTYLTAVSGGGLNDLKAALADKISFSEAFVNGNGSGDIAVGGGFRGMLLTNGVGNNVKGLYIVSANSTASVIASESVKAASAISISQPSTGVLRITNSDSNVVKVTLISA